MTRTEEEATGLQANENNRNFTLPAYPAQKPSQVL